MKFKITEIEFDFTTDDGEYELQPSKQRKIVDSVLNRVWDVDDEDDLTDAISDETGWCIRSINYIESHDV